jgi:hypothetical protein
LYFVGAGFALAEQPKLAAVRFAVDALAGAASERLRPAARTVPTITVAVWRMLNTASPGWLESLVISNVGTGVCHPPIKLSRLSGT